MHHMFPTVWRKDPLVGRNRIGFITIIEEQVPYMLIGNKISYAGKQLGQSVFAKNSDFFQPILHSFANISIINESAHIDRGTFFFAGFLFIIVH